MRFGSNKQRRHLHADVATTGRRIFWQTKVASYARGVSGHRKKWAKSRVWQAKIGNKETNFFFLWTTKYIQSEPLIYGSLLHTRACARVLFIVCWHQAEA